MILTDINRYIFKLKRISVNIGLYCLYQLISVNPLLKEEGGRGGALESKQFVF